jgi:RNA polymerase sigma-70 factor (ECF subfamily)
MTDRNVAEDRDERFEAIYRRRYTRVYRFYRVCGVTDEEAHDLAQDAFKRFYEKFDLYRGEAEWSYLERIARNVLYNWVRAQKTFKRGAVMVDIDDPELVVDPPAPEEPDYADRQDAELRRARLGRAVAELPQGQRECLRLRIQGLTYDQIAAALRISVDAVKSRLRDAKRHLRERLGGDR